MYTQGNQMDLFLCLGMSFIALKREREREEKPGGEESC